MFVTRLTFAYHYFPCTIFLALAVGRCFDIDERNLPYGKVLTAAFVLMSFAVFVLFYPKLAGVPVPKGILRSWLPTWPF